MTPTTELKEKIIEVFTQDAPTAIRTLKEAAVNNNVPKFQREIHHLCAFARSVNALDVLDVATQIEHHARQPDMPSAIALLPNLEQEFDRAFQEMLKTGTHKRLKTIEVRLNSLEHSNGKLLTTFTDEMESLRKTVETQLLGVREVMINVRGELKDAIREGIKEGMMEISRVTSSMIPISIFMKIFAIIIFVLGMGIGLRISLPQFFSALESVK